MRSSPTGLPRMSLSGVRNQAYSETPSLTRSPARAEAMARSTTAGGARVQSGDHRAAARGEKQKFAAAGVVFQAAGHQGVHLETGYQHVDQGLVLTARLHVNRGHGDVIQRAVLREETLRLFGKAIGGGLYHFEGQREIGFPAERHDHLALGVGHQEKGVLIGNLAPQLAQAVLDGGAVAGAEGGAHIGHVAHDAAHGGKQVGPGLPQRSVRAEAGPHLILQAVRHGAGDVVEHDLAGDGEQNGDGHGGGEQDLRQQRQPGESASALLASFPYPLLGRVWLAVLIEMRRGNVPGFGNGNQAAK